jgi:hypothetical protein
MEFISGGFMYKFLMGLFLIVGQIFASSDDFNPAASLRLASIMLARDEGAISSVQYQALSHDQSDEFRGIIKGHLEKFLTITNDTDVHVLDSYVASKIGQLDAVGEALKLGDASLDIDTQKTLLFTRLEEYPHIFTEYNGTAVTLEQEKDFIGRVYPGLHPTDLHIYSRSMTLADRIFQETGDTWPLNRIYDCIAENYLTHGGCYQGRRNRIFVVYASMLQEYAFNVSVS